MVKRRRVLYFSLFWGAFSLLLFAFPASLQSEWVISRPTLNWWGTVSAAYQVEDGISNDWSAAGVKPTQSITQGHSFTKDTEQMQQMGLNAYRFSIEWARIQPEPNRWDEQALADYRQQIKTLRRKGIEPFVTLWHFTQPVWFSQRGGWANPQAVAAYQAYVHKVVSTLAPDVEYWITINEPVVYAVMAYYKGRWPPFQEQGVRGVHKVLKHLFAGHQIAYQEIHQLDSNAQVSLSKSLISLKAKQRWNPWQQAKARGLQMLFNQSAWYYLGWQPQKSLDWIGINFYARYYIAQGLSLRNQQGDDATYHNRESSATDFYEQIVAISRFFKHSKPILITENGIADQALHTESRACFLLQHLAMLSRAQQANIPIQGYFHWSLTDNFEWTEGFAPRFGLLNRNRQWKPAAYTYQAINLESRVFPLGLQQCARQPLTSVPIQAVEPIPKSRSAK